MEEIVVIRVSDPDGSIFPSIMEILQNKNVQIIHAVNCDPSVVTLGDTHVLLDDVPGLAPTSLLLLEQIRTVDRRRLRGYIGQISKKKMKEIDAALAISVGLRSLA